MAGISQKDIITLPAQELTKALLKGKYILNNMYVTVLYTQLQERQSPNTQNWTIIAVDYSPQKEDQNRV